MTYNTTRQVDIGKLTISKPDFPDIQENLMNIMEEFVIYEDVSQSSISAKLVLRDQVNLVGVLPVVGGETIRFSYKTPTYSEYVDLEFIVYKVGERPIGNDNSNVQVSILHLCTPELWWAASNDVSLGLQGTYDEIVDRLLNLFPGQKKKAIEKEKTMGIAKYAVPNINIFRSINFCAIRSFDNVKSPFLFWETTKGYKFKPIRSIYDTAAVKSIFVGDRSMYGQDTDPEKLSNTVLTWEYLESNDRLSQNNNRSFGGKFFFLDISTASLSMREYDYNTSFNESAIHLEGFPLNDETKAIRNKTGFIKVNPDGSHDIEWLRSSVLDLMKNYRFLVSVPGDSNLEAGNTIWFNIPSVVGHEVDQEKMTSGKFVVSSIKHLIQKETYTQVLELDKDSFAVQVRQNEVK